MGYKITEVQLSPFTASVKSRTLIRLSLVMNLPKRIKRICSKPGTWACGGFDRPKTGEKIPSIICIDRLINEVVALRQEWMRMPNEFKGVILNGEQKQTLLDGKPFHLEGMISKKGEPFNVPIQYNADTLFIEFLFDRQYGKLSVRKSNILGLF